VSRNDTAAGYWIFARHERNAEADRVWRPTHDSGTGEGCQHSAVIADERGSLISGGLLLLGGLIGLLFIRPERGRQALAHLALPAPSVQPAGS
jgi:hypothetical protein